MLTIFRICRNCVVFVHMMVGKDEEYLCKKEEKETGEAGNDVW